MVIATVITPPCTTIIMTTITTTIIITIATIITTTGLKNDNMLNDDSRFGMVVIKLFTIFFFYSCLWPLAYYPVADELILVLQFSGGCGLALGWSQVVAHANSTGWEF